MWRHPRRHGTLWRYDERCKAPKIGERAFAHLPKRHDSEAILFWSEISLWRNFEIRSSTCNKYQRQGWGELLYPWVKASDIITATLGWANEPTFTRMENILGNQKALDKHMSKVSMNDEQVFLGFFLLITTFFFKY